MSTPQSSSTPGHGIRGSWRVSRRTFLRGVGATIALPLLDVMHAPRAWAGAPQAAAAAGGKPLRLGYVYFPNGSARGTWKPRKVGPDGQLEQLCEWMSPLEAYKKDILIPSNLWTPEGNGHGKSTATWLTGGDYDERTVDAGGPSMDQIIAGHVGRDTVMPSMELSLKGEGNFSKNLPRNNLSWGNARTPMRREFEPRMVFDQMFLTQRGGAVDASVLDRVSAHAADLKRNASADDKRKIDEYLESIRGVERRISFAEKISTQASADRALTDTLIRPSAGIPIEHENYVRLMLDLMALAWWADATRVASFMLDHGQSNRYFNFIPGVNGTWHALSHWREFNGKSEDDDGVTAWESQDSKLQMYNKVTRWHHEQFAYLLGRLSELKEDGEPLINRCLILYGSGIADGHAHEMHDLPLLVAGHGKTASDPVGIRCGRLLEHRKPTSLSRLHLAMARRAGVPIEAFADAQEPLEGL